ncbi:MAG: HDIG domain-containing protein [Geobacter sp.]|nr:HDIG domain-containing protein [Geobacter sp.]
MPSHNGYTEKDIKAGLASLSGKILDSLVGWFSRDTGDRFRRAVFLPVATALVLTVLILPSQQFISIRYKAGEIATADVKASQDYLVEDIALTEKKRDEAEAAAPYVYLFDNQAGEKIRARFEKALDAFAESRRGVSREGKGPLQDELATTFGLRLASAELAALSRVRSERMLLGEIERVVAQVYSRKIVSDMRIFETDLFRGVVISNPENGQEIGVGDYSTYLDMEQARKLTRKQKLNLDIDRHDLELIRGVLVRSVQPNLSFSREKTDEKLRKARESVSPVLFQVKRGEMVVREGERINDQQALKLKKIYEAPRGINRLVKGIGIFGIVLVLFYFPFRFARKNIRKFNPTNKDILLLAIGTAAYFAILRISLVIASGLGGLLPSIVVEDYFYLFPFAIGAMLVRIILNSEVALVYAMVCAPLVGIMFNSSLTVLLYAMLGSLVGAHGVRQCKDRGTIYTAGLKVSVVNLALAFCFQILSDSLFTMQSVYCLLFAVAGGILSAVIVTGLVPLIETLFHYTTDIKLLELANMNSPVLRELMISAPGTYHHSVVVGNLVEAAAEAIHANPLLARVAALYHDVGKISKPLYFIENVSGGDNRHDRLSPNMSALILISHVKEGVELAREHRLGLPIIDIIRQSHGTALITYFYQKAKNLEEPEVQTVEERDFRYPGPKPQTREAGIVMLADCVEAASRTLTDPTPARIQGMVQKIINNIFTDGQLDECELTLKNLHEIAKSFNIILSGIYHHRIDYPEPAYKERAVSARKPSEDIDREPAKAPQNRDEEPKKGGGEDIRRLGISR